MLMYKLHVKETQRCMRHVMIPKYTLTPNLGFLPQIIYRYTLELDLARTETRGQGHNVLETVSKSLGSKMYRNATINKIGDLLWVHVFKNWLLRSRSQWIKNSERHSMTQHISTNYGIWYETCSYVQCSHRPGKNWHWSWKTPGIWKSAFCPAIL